MAGLIQQQMGAPAAEQQPAPGGEQMPPGAGEQGGDEQLEGEDNPVFQQAITFAYEALYANGAANDVAKSLKAAPSMADGLADTAYNITSVIDERTDGQVPDELLVPLAMQVLQEVAEVAEAANLNPQPEDVAQAFKTMILRYMGEQGVDTSQLQQAMDQVDPAVFRQAAEQGDEEAGEMEEPGEQSPMEK